MSFYTLKFDKDIFIKLRVKKIIFSGRSKYQKIEVLEVPYLGRVLMLDGDIQLSELDEHLYHEHLVHPAMLAHRRPREVLVIGGGDGGAVKEILKHSVDNVTLIDIDEKVIEISKRYLKFCGRYLNDKNVEVVIGDGKKFVEECIKENRKFDVVIVDITTPIGPSRALYTKKFYSDIFDVLKKDGCVSLHCLSPFFELKKKYLEINKTIRGVFPYAVTYLAHVPSFFEPWSFVLASKRKISIRSMEKRFKETKINSRAFTPSNLKSFRNVS